MKIRLLAAGLGLIMSSAVFGASDGVIGVTSTGSSDISLTLPQLILARSFADFSLGSYSGLGDLNGNDDLNISTNYSPGDYELTASGSGAGGAFTLTDGSELIAYNAYFNDATGIVGRAALANGVPLTGQGGAADTLADATLNANLSVEVLEAALQAVGAGVYTGTITLVFTPE